MAHFKEKVEVIFIPYLKVLIVFTIINVFMIAGGKWLLPTYEPERYLSTYMLLSIFISLALILWHLNKRFKVFDTEKGTFGIVIIVAAGMCASSYFLYQFVNTIIYPLTRIHAVDEIRTKPFERYYEIAHFDSGSDTIFPYYSSEVSGKDNTNLSYYCYIVFPLRAPTDRLPDSVGIWYGLSLERLLSNGAGSDEKEKVSRELNVEVEHEIKNINPGRAVYYERIGYGDHYEEYIEAIKKTSRSAATNIILEPRMEKFSKRSNAWLPLLISYGTSILIMLLFVAIGVPHINLLNYLKYSTKIGKLDYTFERK